MIQSHRNVAGHAPGKGTPCAPAFEADTIEQPDCRFLIECYAMGYLPADVDEWLFDHGVTRVNSDPVQRQWALDRMEYEREMGSIGYTAEEN